MSFVVASSLFRDQLGVAGVKWLVEKFTSNMCFKPMNGTAIMSTIEHSSHGPFRCFNASSMTFALNKRKSGKSYTSKKHLNKSKSEVRKAKAPRTPFRNIPDPVEQQRKKTPSEVPPAFLVPTASPYAFISKCAVMDQKTGEVFVDPMSLYSGLYPFSRSDRVPNSSIPLTQKQKNTTKVPYLFRKSYLHYFPPSFFPNHEPPTDGTPEVAFLGRSNTGKSSLINALSSILLRSGGGVRKNTNSGGGELARTSKHPGRTQTINYFGLIPNSSRVSKQPNNKHSKMYLVDLPGFGYACAPNDSIDKWQERTQQFLISRALLSEAEVEQSVGTQSFGTRVVEDDILSPKKSSHDMASPPLKRLYLLIDSRLPEPTLIDLTVMGWCDDYSIPYTIVLTKVDGASRANCVKLTNQLCMRYHSLFMDEDPNQDIHTIFMDPIVYWTSSKDRLGMEELLLSVQSNLIVDEDAPNSDISVE